MDGQNCVFCEKSLEEGNTVKLYLKGCDTINQASKKRGDNIEVKEGDRIHKECRRTYTKEYSTIIKKKVNKSDKVSHGLRSGSAVFCYDTKCLFCCKTFQERMFKAEPQRSEKQLAYKVRSDSFQQEVKAKCLERKDTWTNEVIARIGYSRDLMASNSVYHQSCSTKFRLGRDPDEDCNEPPAKKRNTVSGRNLDIKREDALLQAVNYLKENDEEQLTIQDLVLKMGQLCENPFSLKHMKRRLLDYFGERVIITEMKGKPNIITLRSTASNILQKFYSLPKPEDTEQQKLRVIETAAKLIHTDIKTVDTRKDIYPSAEDISTPEKRLTYLPESLKILLMKTFVGKNAQLKQAAVGHAIMQAVRPRAVIAPLQICLGVQLHLKFGSRFLIETLHELGFCSSYQEVQKYQQSAAVSQPLEIPGLIQGQFLQFVADNIDHNTQTLDGLNTFHGMGMISAVTPGIKCTSRRIPCVTVTAEDVAAVAKVDIHFDKNVERFNIKYEKLPDISIDDNSRNTDILWKLSWLLRPTTPACNGTMQLVHHGEYPGPSLINFLPMIDMDSTNESCIYSTLHFVADKAKLYGVTPVLTFDQPLWMKAQHIIDAEPSTSRSKNIVLRLGGFHMEMSFLGSTGHIMTETGLKDLFSVVYAENTVPHMLSGKAIARAIRAHTLVELALHALIAADIFEINRPDNNAVLVNDEESIDQANVRHNRDERSDAIITLDINEQAAHVHDNAVAEEAMKLFDNLMKHEVDLADVESDENVKNIVQLLDTKLEDMSKKNRILRKFVKAERTGNWMLHL